MSENWSCQLKSGLSDRISSQNCVCTLSRRSPYWI